jgi:16S rRNA (cytosine967-C5)-methyltransferase
VKKGKGPPAVGRDKRLREDLVTQACLEAYGAIAHEGRLSDRALDFTLRHKKNLWSQERRAVSERIYYLLRRQQTVEWVLDRTWNGFASASTTQKDLLRLCAARVMAGESPSDVAGSVSLGADAARALAKLDGALGELSTLPTLERLIHEASLPRFLAEQFLADLKDDALPLALSMNERAPLCARTNALKGTREELAKALKREDVPTRPTPYSPFGLVLETRLNAYGLNAFKDGAFELQDEGSQLLGMLADAPRGLVIDACAGAGGKTLQLAGQMKNKGDLFAMDIDERRLEELRLRARRAGVHNVRVRAIPLDGPEADKALEDLAGKAERVLVDAPCSGTGTFRRKPDARYRLTPERLAEDVQRQTVLLERFSKLVKPKGRLIYGTCSVLRCENEEVVEKFLSAHPEFEQVDASTWLGEAAPKLVRGKALRLFPHLHGTDGFFGAVLVKKSA